MSVRKELHLISQKIRALSQNGLVYAENEYDRERYEELFNLSNKISALIHQQDIGLIEKCFTLQDDYVTPKTDVRAVVFNENNEILLVQEKADARWSLPGGWADVGFSPVEVAEKEVKEETGLDVKAKRLLAVLDKQKHPHPPAAHYVYKIFILCEITGGAFSQAFDILDKGFFKQGQLPPLSKERVLIEQIDLMFEYNNNPTKEAIID
ncbi:MAG: NUDIX hydrolase N-terminal domain-containing protein [Prevotellaceae bacterium]|jgi:ADP-ribose pyrophosphatase YjhB (NUDIX family)|nr:NUDIX hydrolase N-terminal domain-containing protein [Prevotellaceae bacterium]